MSEPVWYPAARELVASGLGDREVGRLVGVDRSSVYLMRNPRCRELKLARQRGHYYEVHRTPEYVARTRRSNLRRAAREEAAETGEDVRRLYERWDCA